MYTTIDNVRQFSGFDDPTKISGTTIRKKISMADAKVDSSLAYRYQLPLPYHRQNRIVFSGTGNGTGTLSVVINSVTYNISIVNSMTASEAADAFRVAAEGSAHFVTEGYTTDDTSGDASVTIISLSDSGDISYASAEVNITSAGGTVNGITGTAKTREDRYPPIIEQLSAEIATALLYMDSYGIEAEDTPRDGRARMEALDKMLAQIQGTSEDGVILRITDEITKAELPQSTSGLPSYLPTPTTSDADYGEEDSTHSVIKMNDKY